MFPNSPYTQSIPRSTVSISLWCAVALVAWAADLHDVGQQSPNAVSCLGMQAVRCQNLRDSRPCGEKIVLCRPLRSTRRPVKIVPAHTVYFDSSATDFHTGAGRPEVMARTTRAKRAPDGSAPDVSARLPSLNHVSSKKGMGVRNLQL